jgi:hypothetical protein
LRWNNNLVSKLCSVKYRLGRVNVQWAIFAGVAAYCYGSRRKVTDIDVLVKNRDLANAQAFLRDVDGVDVAGDLRINVDDENCFFFMDSEMEKRIQWRKFLEVDVPIIPVEDNIIFKAILQRGEEQGKHDVEDIKRMIKKEKIDLAYMKKRMQKYNAEKRAKPLLKHLGIL